MHVPSAQTLQRYYWPTDTGSSICRQNSSGAVRLSFKDAYEYVASSDLVDDAPFHPGKSALRMFVAAAIWAVSLLSGSHLVAAAPDNVSADGLIGTSTFTAPGVFPTSVYSKYYNSPTATSAQVQPVISDPATVCSHSHLSVEVY